MIWPRVVYDAVLFVQAIISRRGPARACFDKMEQIDVENWTSETCLKEVRRVLGRTYFQERYPELTPEFIDTFIRRIQSHSKVRENSPRRFVFLRDPNDEYLLNLAVDVQTNFIVTRDKDMLDLMTGADAEAVAFRTQWPQIAILDPVAFLRTFDDPGEPCA